MSFRSDLNPGLNALKMNSDLVYTYCALYRDFISSSILLVTLTCSLEIGALGGIGALNIEGSSALETWAFSAESVEYGLPYFVI